MLKQIYSDKIIIVYKEFVKNPKLLVYRELYFMKIGTDINGFDKFTLSKNINDLTKTKNFANKMESAVAKKDRLVKVAKEFESIIINLMLKSMRKTISKNKLIDGGMGEEVFQSLLDEQYSKKYFQNIRFRPC